jgi:hypothetical protein
VNSIFNFVFRGFCDCFCDLLCFGRGLRRDFEAKVGRIGC